MVAYYILSAIGWFVLYPAIFRNENEGFAKAFTEGFNRRGIIFFVLISYFMGNFLSLY